MFTNLEEIETSELRKKALQIVQAGIESVLPEKVVKQKIKWDGEKKELIISNKVFLVEGRIFIIGAGKNVDFLAAAIEDQIGLDTIEAGIIATNKISKTLKKIEVRVVGHPIPNEDSVKATDEMLALKKEYNINEKDVVLCLLTAGASSMLCKPWGFDFLHEGEALLQELYAKEAEVQEIKVLRKHFSGVKGGRLAEFYAPTKIISIIISDVVDNDLSVIASGPTMPDETTFTDAIYIIKKYNLLSKISKSLLDFIEKGRDEDVSDTPKELTNVDNFIIADNATALAAMEEKAKKMNLIAKVVTDQQTGQPKSVAKLRSSEIMTGMYFDYNVVIIGGETFPKLPEKHGEGGRNQHYALSFLSSMEGYTKKWVLASIATDGQDFMENIGGAIVDHETLKKIRAMNLDINSSLEHFDSYNLLNQVKGSIVRMNSTGTNVNDVICFIAE
ncbi:MAG TPA: DUF4147 domain-containing protein [Chlamydiales bacterium]|nr:DUF4147 domain-containing protein [Chlamydiales bacterium]